MSELQAAVERLRRMRADSDAFDGGYPDTPEGRTQATLDHVCLAEAYLAEHPADDDEPVTEDSCPQWSQKVAGTKRLAYVIADHQLFTVEWCPQCGSLPAILCVNHWSVKQHPTRGDVRRLCSVLGITLKE